MTPSPAEIQTNTTNDEDHLIQPVLTSEESNFKPLKTIPAFSIHLLISTLISCVGI
uniref:Uncharacterized protein n=1 Tax=Megaselia scalaris TaxID=36166 RepID=T1H4R1_MEGSC